MRALITSTILLMGASLFCSDETIAKESAIRTKIVGVQLLPFNDEELSLQHLESGINRFLKNSKIDSNELIDIKVTQTRSLYTAMIIYKTK